MIGADRVGGFPLNTACAGFVYARSIAYALIKSEIYSNILVVSSETLSRVVDYGDPSTAVLFADGLITKIGIPKEKVCRVIHSIGNTSRASAAISLDMAIRGKADDVKINPGDIIGLTAIAGGYSAGAIIFKY